MDQGRSGRDRAERAAHTRSRSGAQADVRRRVSPGVPVGCGHRRLPGRGGVEPGWKRRVHLGSVLTPARPHQERRHGRCRLRQLSLLQERHRPVEGHQRQELQVFHQLAQDHPQRERSRQREGPGLLQETRRLPAECRHPALGDTVPLGSSASSGRRGRMAHQGHGRPVRGLLRRDGAISRGPGAALVSVQRAEDLHPCRLLVWCSCARSQGSDRLSEGDPHRQSRPRARFSRPESRRSVVSGRERLRRRRDGAGDGHRRGSRRRGALAQVPEPLVRFARPPRAISVRRPAARSAERAPRLSRRRCRDHEGAVGLRRSQLLHALYGQPCPGRAVACPASM